MGISDFAVMNRRPLLMVALVYAFLLSLLEVSDLSRGLIYRYNVALEIFNVRHISAMGWRFS